MVIIVRSLLGNDNGSALSARRAVHVVALVIALIEDEGCMISDDNHSAPMIATVLHGDKRSLGQ